MRYVRGPAGMRRVAGLFAVLACGGVLGAAPRTAGIATAPLHVTANVPSRCAVALTGVVFGPYVPTAADTVADSAAVSVTCSLGTTWALSADSGLHAAQVGSSGMTRAMASGGNYLPYDLYTDPGTAPTC